MSETEIVSRKAEHIRVCLEEAVGSDVAGGLAGYRLAYRSLPEISLDDVDLSTRVAGKTLSAPLIIGAMTGGTGEARTINRVLAQAAEAAGIGFALGSGRVVLEQPEALDSFRVRDVAPTALIFANLGAVQLGDAYGVTPEGAARLVELTGSDALNLHLNPLQEAVQPGGDTDFRGIAAAIGRCAEALDVPVFVKEVGAGIGPESAALLAALPIDGVETAGVGGTSWAKVEALRADDDLARAAGIALAGFGIPTADSILACRRALPDRTVIASGGLRTALGMATALALGADAVAAALPFLKAAQGGVEAVTALIEHLVHTLRIICFTCGARTPAELRGRFTTIG